MWLRKNKNTRKDAGMPKAKPYAKRRTTEAMLDAARRRPKAADRFAHARAVKAEIAASRRYAPKPLGVPVVMTTDDAVNLYRLEKQAAESRRQAKIADVKRAYAQLMADVDVARRGGRPRKSKGAAASLTREHSR